MSEHIFFSPEDQQFVAVSTLYPSLSNLAGTEVGALAGLRMLVVATEAESVWAHALASAAHEDLSEERAAFEANPSLEAFAVYAEHARAWHVRD